jgi:translation initiation factor IF-2
MARKKTRHKISSNPVDQKKLEVVLKCDVAGTAEAISASLAEINVPGVQIDLIQTGIHRQQIGPRIQRGHHAEAGAGNQRIRR